MFSKRTNPWSLIHIKRTDCFCFSNSVHSVRIQLTFWLQSVLLKREWTAFVQILFTLCSHPIDFLVAIHSFKIKKWSLHVQNNKAKRFQQLLHLNCQQTVRERWSHAGEHTMGNKVDVLLSFKLFEADQ